MSSLIPRKGTQKNQRASKATSGRSRLVRRDDEAPRELALPEEGEFQSVTRPEEGKALQLANWITEMAISGVPPLCSAEKLALEYQHDNSYLDDGARIDSLIQWETTKNFTSGFITGLGGLLTLPLAVPASFGASWIIQARMAASIAKIAGHDITSDRVKTFVVASLAGNACKDVLKDVGIKVGNSMARVAIQQVPGKVLIEINKKIGFRLLTKAGEKGAVNLMKAVPIAGGLVGGAFDATTCQVVGRWAKKLFYSGSEL
jgi:uncharacterized protein (DUF697 family)